MKHPAPQNLVFFQASLGRLLALLVLASPLCASEKIIDTFAEGLAPWEAGRGAAAIHTTEASRVDGASAKVAATLIGTADAPHTAHITYLLTRDASRRGDWKEISVDVRALWVRAPREDRSRHRFGRFANFFLVLSSADLPHTEIDPVGGEHARKLEFGRRWKTFTFEIPEDMAFDLNVPDEPGMWSEIGFGVSAGVWGQSPFESLAALDTGIVLYIDNIRFVPREPKDEKSSLR